MMGRIRVLLLIGLMTASATGTVWAQNAAPTTQQPYPDAIVQVYAAGSLREALTQIAKKFEAAQNADAARTVARIIPKLTFGASGLLRERIEKGEAADVFASADMAHPERLSQQGGWVKAQAFTRNSLCALGSKNIDLSSDNLLQTMLNPQVRLGISTPKADPSGDYAFALFAKAQALQAGAQAALESKALQLTGGAQSPLPPAGRNAYAWLMAENKADLFLTYCTNAVLAKKELPELKIVSIPPALQVSALYGLTYRQDAQAQSQAFVRYIKSEAAQAIFRDLGFSAP